MKKGLAHYARGLVSGGGSARRRRTVAGGVSLLIAAGGFIALAGPASAHANAVTGSASCQSDGTYQVTWTIANDYNLTETATVTAKTPSASTVTPGSVAIGKHGSNTVVQTGIAGTNTSASLTVHAKWSDNYERNDSGSVTLSGTCQPQIPVPGAPSVSPPTCDAAGAVVLPADTDTIDWSIAPNGTNKFKVTATAKSGYVFANGKTSVTFDLTVKPKGYGLDCRSEVVPVTPTVTDASCNHTSGVITAPTLVTATTTGIDYYVYGTVGAGNTVTVKAYAKDDNKFVQANLPAGWQWVNDGYVKWVHTFGANPSCDAYVTPATPAFTDAQCTGAPGVEGNASYTITAQTGVVYSKAPGTYSLAPGASVTITATPASGYSFNGATNSWTFTATDRDCRSGVVPVDPQVTAGSCDHGTGVVGAPGISPVATVGIDYKVEGLVVTATPQAGYKLGTLPAGWSGSESSATFTVVAPTVQCDIYVTPAAPELTDAQCTGEPGVVGDASYTITAQPGVVYSKAPGTYSLAAGESVTITATPAEGYAFNEATASWTLTASTPNCDVAVLPVDPTVTQAVCDGPGHSTTPTVVPVETAGVTYVVSEDLRTVTATLEDGYEWTMPLPSGWVLDEEMGTASFAVTLADPGACLVDVTSVSPEFSDNACVSTELVGATYTLPELTGIAYLVDGVPTAAGTYAAADGSTVVVNAVAETGYTLVGAMTWSHTFVATPSCGAVAGVTSSRTPTATVSPAASQPLASTGVPVLWLVLAGGIILLGGAAMTIGATRRGRFQR